MLNVVLLLALAGMILWAAANVIRRARKGSGCCEEHEAAEKKATVTDRNKAHYPYEVRLELGGMTCGNCARKVENALNRLEGTWAAVKLDDHTAAVRLKLPPDEKLLRQTVQQAGYVVMGIRVVRKPDS